MTRRAIKEVLFEIYTVSMVEYETLEYPITRDEFIKKDIQVMSHDTLVYFENNMRRVFGKRIGLPLGVDPDIIYNTLNISKLTTTIHKDI